MKTIEVTIKSEKIYTVEIDETVINQDFIDHFCKYFHDVKQTPAGLYNTSYDDEDIKEEDYPYLNFAEDIAYMQSEYDSDVEGLPLLHNKFYTYKLKNGEIPPIQFMEESEDFEYEFNLENCKL